MVVVLWQVVDVIYLKHVLAHPIDSSCISSIIKVTHIVFSVNRTGVSTVQVFLIGWGCKVRTGVGVFVRLSFFRTNQTLILGGSVCTC